MMTPYPSTAVKSRYKSVSSHSAVPVSRPAAGGPAGASALPRGRAGSFDRCNPVPPDPYAYEYCDDWRVYVPIGVLILLGGLLDACSIWLARVGG